MRHGWIALALSLLASKAVALDVPKANYASLPAQVAVAEDFVPKGWKLERKEEGDLNGDGRSDVVLVLHQDDPANIVHHDGLGEDPLDTNPRILAVAFALPEGGYRLVVQNHALIPRHDEPTIEDMLEEGGVSVVRGTLQVNLHFFANAGSWEIGSTTYTFRWQGGRFELIGYDRSTAMRNSGDSEEISINFSTRKLKRTTGNMRDDVEKVRWETWASSRRWTLDEVGDGGAFDPLAPPGR